jgi:imidazolonepropionase-like amidohydrolase
MAESTVIKADRIFTPPQGLLDNYSLVLQGATIKEIIPHSQIRQGYEIHEFTGYTLAPPFCDYHLHFSKKNLPSIKKAALDLLNAGIIKVLEGGDRDKSGFTARDALKGTIEVITAGTALYKKEGYGKFLGIGINTVKEASGVIDRLVLQGADYLKVVNSGIFIPQKNEFTSGGFKDDEITEIVSIAHERGLKVICHANTEKAVRDSVTAGVDTIVHGFGVSEDTLSLMADKNVAFIPTVNALHSLCAITDHSDCGTIKRATDQHLRAIKKAFDRGVKILPGSDSGPSFIPYGKAFSEELAFFKKASIPEQEILFSSVSGSLQAGTEARFIILKGLEVKKVFTSGAEAEKFFNLRKKI